jgi:alpha-tubulin suppressor-like RCC1 family protein
MPNQFLSPEGDIENYFVSEYWLIDQYIGDELWSWGGGSYGLNGQLGDANVVNRSTPVTTFAGGTNWKQVSSGGAHTAAIKTDGTLWTWGLGTQGRLGNGATTGNISTPVTTFSGGTNWKQVSSGGSHTAAIKTDGTLWTWGYGYDGRLGGGNNQLISTPITTFAGGTNWKQVSSGNQHTAAIKTDGTLWTWGVGSNGRLGNGITTGNRSTPVTTFSGGTNWKQVSSGFANTAAIKTDGTLWIWGQGSYRQLGNAAITDRSTPVTTFAGGTNWKQVSCGSFHNAAIKTDGTLWTWGSGGGGVLGNAQTTSKSTPVTTFAGGTNWKQVSSWGNGISAIKTDGTLWTWGFGSYGQLGNGATTGNRSTPITTFAGGTNWKQVSGGNNFNLSITAGIPTDLPLS